MSDSDGSGRQLGSLLTGIGSTVYLCSVFARFSRGVLATANILFFLGIFLILGAERSQRLLLRKAHAPATALFALGFVFILADRGRLGFLCDLIAAFLMFGGFLPVVVNRLRKLPYIGPYLRIALPGFLYGIGEESLPR
jgi:hypothetical protein